MKFHTEQTVFPAQIAADLFFVPGEEHQGPDQICPGQQKDKGVGAAEARSGPDGVKRRDQQNPEEDQQGNAVTEKQAVAGGFPVIGKTDLIMNPDVWHEEKLLFILI